MPEHRGDGRERDAGHDRRDAVAVPKPPGARLRALDAGGAHERAHLAVRGLPGDGPQAPVRAPRAALRAPHAVHELERLHQVLRDRNGPPVGSAPFQGRDPDLVRLEIDVARAKAKRFGDPAPGHREGPGEGLHGGLRMRARHGEEPLAFELRQVLSPTRVDELAHHRSLPFRPSDPERYISVWERTTAVCRPPLLAAHTLAVPGRPRPWHVPNATECVFGNTHPRPGGVREDHSGQSCRSLIAIFRTTAREYPVVSRRVFGVGFS